VSSSTPQQETEDDMNNDSWTVLSRLPTKQPARSRHGITHEILREKQQKHIAAERQAALGKCLARCATPILTFAAHALNLAADRMQRLATAIEDSTYDARPPELAVKPQKAS